MFAFSVLLPDETYFSSIIRTFLDDKLERSVVPLLRRPFYLVTDRGVSAGRLVRSVWLATPTAGGDIS
jgi:hypothetical protein